MNRNTAIGIAVAVLVGSSTIAALAQDNQDSPPPGEGVDQVEVVQANALEAMSALNDARTSTDEMPADIAERIDAKADFGMNPALSRRAVAETAVSVYLVPANGHVCASLTIDYDATVTCARTADIAAGQAGPATASLYGEAIAVYGMVPDGVGSVNLNVGESETIEVATTRNVFYTVVPAGTALRTVSYTGPSGAVEWPIYDPTTAFEEG